MCDFFLKKSHILTVYILSNNFQRGQVLPLTLVLLPMVLAVVFYMFNSGQLVQEKIGLTNTADAVAYSAGVYEARVLNYDAYANRAMVANEIAIAQAVGLASWTRYASSAAVSIGPYLGMIPGANAATLIPALQQVRINRVAILQMLSDAVTSHNQAIQSLKAAQSAVHGVGNATAIANRNAVIAQVKTLNDPNPNVIATTIPNAGLGDIDFAAFTQYYGLAKRHRMLEAVLNSREEFLRDPEPNPNPNLDIQGRNWDTGERPDCAGNATPSLEKEGTTDIPGVELGGNTIGYNRWNSLDQLTYYYLEYPAIYDVDGNIVGYDCYLASQVVASGIADSRSTAFPFVEQGAIPEFYDLSESVLAGSRLSTQLTIRVTQPSADQRYSGGDSPVQPSGSLDLYDGNHAVDTATGNAVSAAIAKVEVYFERPDNFLYPNGAQQRGSLFNPYWQVRLVNTNAERAAAWLLQGF